MRKIRKNNNIVFDCHYHVVWCTKYRLELLTGSVERELKDIIREVASELGVRIEELEVMPDHVHLLIDCDPQFGVHRVVKRMKGRSSRVLREHHYTVRGRTPSLWTNSYFVATTGGASLQVIKKYVASQKLREK